MFHFARFSRIKFALVLVYCRSGDRSGKSLLELGAKGHTNIYNATGLESLKATKP